LSGKTTLEISVTLKAGFIAHTSKGLRSCPAAFDFVALISKRLTKEINPSNSSEFWWTFSHLEAKITSKLVGGFVGFCAGNCRVFQSVPNFAWKRKTPIKIALKSMF